MRIVSATEGRTIAPDRSWRRGRFLPQMLQRAWLFLLLLTSGPRCLKWIVRPASTRFHSVQHRSFAHARRATCNAGATQTPIAGLNRLPRVFRGRCRSRPARPASGINTISAAPTMPGRRRRRAGVLLFMARTPVPAKWGAVLILRDGVEYRERCVPRREV